jgi:hypothetical protein
MGVFPQNIRLPLEYSRWEREFVSFSKELGVRAAILDAVIWRKMREFSPTLVRRLT